MTQLSNDIRERVERIQTEAVYELRRAALRYLWATPPHLLPEAKSYWLAHANDRLHDVDPFFKEITQIWADALLAPKLDQSWLDTLQARIFMIGTARDMTALHCLVANHGERKHHG